MGSSMNIAWTYNPAREHRAEDHPENPDRFSRLPAIIRTRDLLPYLEARPATLEEIARVHSPQLIVDLDEAGAHGPAIIDPAPTYVNPDSYQAALLAAGAVLFCARRVLAGRAESGFALVRPPGHHAEPDRAMGFCLFNNLAVGVADMIARGLQRILIVDFDAHHGNGTQAAFKDEERVMFISMHQEGIYPGSGRIDDVPQGRGRMVNVPLPARAGDQAYGQVMKCIVVPLAERFQPEMVFVSAGFDAHWGDPLTQLGLSTAGFFSISKTLVEIAGRHSEGRIIFSLEGGYDPQHLANGVGAVFDALNHAETGPDVDDPSPYPEPDVSERIEQIRQWHEIE
jgi:acetoin utilization deacetylase AcuC-like enzyme